MRVYFVSLFPEMFTGPMNYSIIGRARASGLLNIEIINPRDFAFNKHNTVDDYPFGGGAGMLIRPEPIFRAVEHIRNKTGVRGKVILLTPGGTQFTQATAQRLSQCSQLIFICGHYEGIDDRVREYLADECLSIGDYVLTGGELAAMVMTDAVVRLQDGVLGSSDSYADESFSNGRLEYPQYTRPRSYRGMNAPSELLSGNHALIEAWRFTQSQHITEMIRPDLLENCAQRVEDD